MSTRETQLILLRKLTSLRRLPAMEILTTIRVIALVAIIEVAVRVASLPRLARHLGIGLGLPPEASGRPAIVWTATEKRQVRSARRVVRNWMLGPGPCLRESLVIGYLLRRRDPHLQLGVAHRGTDLAAHAWLVVGDATIGAQGGYEPFDWVTS